MNMPLTLRKLLTIVCEARLEPELADELTRLGARGYTIADARGQGVHGLRDAAWGASANIRVEVLCDEPTVERIVAALHTRYSAHYGMVMFVTDAAVLRPDKFCGAVG